MALTTTHAYNCQTSQGSAIECIPARSPFQMMLPLSVTGEINPTTSAAKGIIPNVLPARDKACLSATSAAPASAYASITNDTAYRVPSLRPDVEMSDQMSSSEVSRSSLSD